MLQIACFAGVRFSDIYQTSYVLELRVTRRCNAIFLFVFLTIALRLASFAYLFYPTLNSLPFSQARRCRRNWRADSNLKGSWHSPYPRRPWSARLTSPLDVGRNKKNSLRLRRNFRLQSTPAWLGFNIFMSVCRGFSSGSQRRHFRWNKYKHAGASDAYRASQYPVRSVPIPRVSLRREPRV